LAGRGRKIGAASARSSPAWRNRCTHEPTGSYRPPVQRVSRA